MRKGVNWFIWRIVISQDVPDGLLDVRRRWSFADALEAHLALDAIEQVRKIEAPE